MKWNSNSRKSQNSEYQQRVKKITHNFRFLLLKNMPLKPKVMLTFVDSTVTKGAIQISSGK